MSCLFSGGAIERFDISNNPCESFSKAETDQIENFFDDDSDGFVQKENLQSLQSLSENPRSILNNPVTISSHDIQEIHACGFSKTARVTLI